MEEIPPGDYRPSEPTYAEGKGRGAPLSIDYVIKIMNILISRLPGNETHEIMSEKENFRYIYGLLEYKLVSNEATMKLNQFKQDIEDINKILEIAGPDPALVGTSYTTQSFAIHFREAEIMILNDIIGSCEAGINVIHTNTPLVWHIPKFYPRMKKLYDVIMNLKPKEGLGAKPFDFKLDMQKDMPRELNKLFRINEADEQLQRGDAKTIDRFLAKYKGTGGKRRNKRKTRVRRHRSTRRKQLRK